jgi:hypothetical protein
LVHCVLPLFALHYVAWKASRCRRFIGDTHGWRVFVSPNDRASCQSDCVSIRGPPRTQRAFLQIVAGLVVHVDRGVVGRVGDDRLGVGGDGRQDAFEMIRPFQDIEAVGGIADYRVRGLLGQRRDQAVMGELDGGKDRRMAGAHGAGAGYDHNPRIILSDLDVNEMSPAFPLLDYNFIGWPLEG